jgi:acetyltransferase
MSIRNLDAIFRPRSVALIGASNRPGSIGLVIAENLLAGGFDGPIIPVNPKHKAITGVLAYPDVASMPLSPDLAVICTPPATVPELIAQLARRGTKGAIVITAGFGELGNAGGRALQTAMLDAARPHLMRIIGPNCLGVLSTPFGLNASFAPGNAKKGGIAFVTQSGAVATTVLDWASTRGIGFSHLVSLGDMVDVDFGDMLDYLANDSATSAILLYIEAVTSARKFISAARAAARLKPVIAVKAGRHQAAAKAASSHTGALAGVDAVYDAAFRRTGILRVRDLDEVFDAVQTLANAPGISREDLVILTNGGGAGVLATDALIDYGGRPTELSQETIEKLNAVLPPTWSHGNPVDIIGDAQANRYADALRILLEAPETNAVLVINCPTAIASSIEAARAVAGLVRGKRRPVLANWLGARDLPAARALFAEAGIPAYDTPTEAVRGLMHVVGYRKGQDIIIEVPSSSATDFSPDEARARGIAAAALAAGETWLNAEGVRDLLACYRIPAARSAFAATPAEAGRLAEGFGVPVALKIVSPKITHKSDVGGVALDLEGAPAVRMAAEAMLARIAASVPDALPAGFLVQEMIRRPGAFELIAGMTVDNQFGPVILFGQGGTAVEVIDDKALALPPLNLRLAQELIGKTRVSRLLRGYRDRPPAALDAIALTLVKLSQLVCDLDEIAEVDLNPLLADSTGVISVDARVRLAPPADKSRRGGRLAIQPYPKELERNEYIAAIGRMTLRPIRPEDAGELSRLIADLTPEDARLRFFTPIRSLEPSLLARFTQIDYDREMAFVMLKEGEPDRFLAVVRLAADPDNIRAEFAIVVRSDLHRRGIGRMLMTRLIEYARSRGLTELFGDILAENAPMLALCSQLGFAVRATETAGVMRAVLRLTADGT